MAASPPNATNTFSGARAIFRINGDKIAFASGVNGGEEIAYEPVDVLDNLEVQEFVPTGYRVNFSCEIFRTVKNTPNALPPREGVQGSVKEMSIFPQAGLDVLKVLSAGLLTCTITDRLTQKTVAQVEECKATSYNWSITARGIVGQNVSFVAVRIKDESEVAG